MYTCIVEMCIKSVHLLYYFKNLQLLVFYCIFQCSQEHYYKDLHINSNPDSKVMKRFRLSNKRDGCEHRLTWRPETGGCFVCAALRESLRDSNPPGWLGCRAGGGRRLYLPCLPCSCLRLLADSEWKNEYACRTHLTCHLKALLNTRSFIKMGSREININCYSEGLLLRWKWNSV